MRGFIGLDQDTENSMLSVRPVNGLELPRPYAMCRGWPQTMRTSDAVISPGAHLPVPVAGESAALDGRARRLAQGEARPHMVAAGPELVPDQDAGQSVLRSPMLM